MCGIAGFLDLRGTIEDPVHALTRMADRLVHRGPDDSGTWWSAPLRIGLAHRRLAILDVSPAGHQPMSSACGRWCVAFNGEAYRFREMRAELDSRRRTRWRGHSDTEVIVECLAEDGFERTIRRLSGMCAIAAVDLHLGRLWLASDRAGKKPLYYGWTAGVFAFASELKALRALGPMPRLDPHAIELFLRYSYVPAPLSIHAGICKVSPGSLVEVDLARIGHERSVDARVYWSIGGLVEKTASSRRAGAVDGDRLEQILEGAVQRRMVADVPVGAFLSGGVDSSIVCALMARVATGRVKTFSIGFERIDLDESQHAMTVARALGTEHETLRISDTEMLAVLSLLPAMFDEPFADSSQIPTFLVSKLARSHVTVALSGDGGDEIFGGYRRYHGALRYWDRVNRIAPRSRRIVAVSLRCLSRLMRPIDGLTSVVPRCIRPIGARLRAVGAAADYFNSQDFPSLYRHMVSGWKQPPVLRRADSGVSWDPILDCGLDLYEMGPRAWMMAVDFQTYLHGDVLVKVDRASMANSLEVRCPFLDPEVIEYAWSMSDGHRVGRQQLKVALHEAARRLVPPEAIDRPKMGFGVPLADWLRGPLRGWMQDLLCRDALLSGGVLDPGPVMASVKALLAGADGEQRRVWTAIALSAWIRESGRVA